MELVAARVPVLADHPLGKGTAGPGLGETGDQWKPGVGGSPGQALRTGSTTVSVAVRGSRFRKLKIGAGHRLDVKASGVFGGSRPGAAPCPAVCEVMGFHAGKNGGCTAIALQQPLDLTAPLGV